MCHNGYTRRGRGDLRQWRRINHTRENGRSAMGITRKFLDWRQPALPAVVENLLERYARGGTLDLDGVIVVVPGGRAGRRLTELLVTRCEERSLLLLPPRHGTVGNLPEYLYESHRPFASDLTQQLAWVQALRQLTRKPCPHFVPRVPDQDDDAGWMSLGGLLQRQHRELAADALHFGDVAQRGRQVAGFAEEERWSFLREVQQRYLGILDELQLWDLQTARLYAIDHQLCRTDQDIVLVATSDMNVAMRRMLDQVADRVTALIHAPEQLASRFDSHGCLVPEAWMETTIELATEQIHVVSGPADQADELIGCLAALDGRYRADQVVIGALDEQLIPQLLRRLEESRVPARWMVGRTLRDTAPYRLLEALGQYLERNRYLDFAALARHPDLDAWLSAQGLPATWLAELDDYFQRHLPARLGEWLGAGCEQTSLPRAVALVEQVLQPLRGTPRPLGQWPQVIAQLLTAFYGQQSFEVDQPQQLYTLRALEAVREALLECEQVPSAIEPVLTASQAISQLLTQVAHEQIPAPHEPDQIELLGWLELPLDTAPALILTGFNEGYVPTSLNSDLFLPNQLRQELQLVDNRRRYARDAYALSALAASRETLTLIAGRHGVDHTPLAPSRLAFATDVETMARRAREFFRERDDEDAPGRPILPLSEVESAVVVPRPRPLKHPITHINVTAFRTYLECPYRFYLRHVLQLNSVADEVEELDAAAFGTLLHRVLTRFGRGKLATSRDPVTINRFLQQSLQDLAAEEYGTAHLPAVHVQLAQARQRLEAFAQWQAQRAADGWEIVHTEIAGDKEKPASLELGNNRSIVLHGRIDRIDRRRGKWAILDYKTGDTARSPQETHRKADQWIDLQLPLYVKLASSLGIEDTPELGYILLPKEIEKVGLKLAEWDDAMLADAHAKAVEVAQAIVAEEFWPPAQLRSNVVSDYASICQEHAFRPHLEGDPSVRA